MSIAIPSDIKPNNNESDNHKSIIMASIAVFIATLTAMIDTGITNSVLPTIAKEFATSEAYSVWVVTAYLLSMVACTLPMASLGEIYGYRRVFIFGLIVFTFASLICGFAWSLETLIFARVFQGIGASCILSTNLALIRFIFPPARLGLGLGLNAICVGVGFSLGAALAALILWVTTWHWLFLINIPIGLICLALAIKSLPHTPLNSYKYDIFAAILCALAFSTLVFAVGQASHQQDIKSIIPTVLVCFFSFVGLIWRQRNHSAPLLAFDLFGYKIFTLSILAVFFVFVAQGIAFIALAFSFFTLLGRSQIEISLLLIPWPLAAAVTSILTGYLADRLRPATLVCFGMSICIIAMLCLSSLTKGSSTAIIVAYMMLCGCGIGFFTAPNQHIVLSSAPRQRSGAAGAIMGLGRLLGQSFGSALVAFFFISFGNIGSKYALYLATTSYLVALVVSATRIILKNKKN